MSVINNVLKDLENKPTSFTPLELTDVADKKSPTLKPLRIWLYVLTIVIPLAAYVIYHLNTSVRNAPVQIIQPEESELVAIIDSVSDESQLLTQSMNDVPIVKQPEFTGLQLNETKLFLELSLRLPLGAQSFLKKSSQNQTVFLISNASKKIVIPDIKDNAWLEKITIDDTAAGIEINFHTLDNVLVETRHKNQGENYNWMIRLKRSLPQINVAATSKPKELAVANSALQLVANKKVTKDESDMQTVNVVSEQRQQVKLDIKPVVSIETDVQILKKARNAMRQQNWIDARQLLEKLLGGRKDIKARVELIALLKYQKKTSEMKQLLLKSLMLYPDERELLVADSGQLFSEKKFLMLINRYKNQQENFSILNLVAASFQKIGQHDNAIIYYQRSLGINPQQPRKWISLAISQEQIAQFGRALQSYKIALQSGSLNQRLQAFIHTRLQKLSQSSN